MKFAIEKKIAGGLVLAFLILVVVGVLACRNTALLIWTTRNHAQIEDELRHFEEILSGMKDAESSVRGYVITGDESFLETYHSAAASMNQEIQHFRELIIKYPILQKKFDVMKSLIADKFKLLEERISLRKNYGFEAAQQAVRSGIGKQVMDDIRNIANEIKTKGMDVANEWDEKVGRSARNTVITILLGGMVIFAISSISVITIYRELDRRRQTEKILSQTLKNEQTARIRAEEAQKALLESEKRSQVIGEAIPFGIWVCGTDGGVTYLSDSFLKLVGMTLEECKQFGWTKRLPPEDVKRTLADWNRCIAGKNFWDYEHKILGNDGFYHTILSRGFPVRDADGNITSWAGINLDITERKHMEEQLKQVINELRKRDQELKVFDESLHGLQAILNSMGDGVIVADLQGKFLYVNPAAEKMLGKELKEVTAYEWSKQYQFYLPDMMTLYIPDKMPLSRAIRGESVDGVEVFVKHVKTSTNLWASVTARPLVAENGELKGGIAVLRDITERKQAELEMERVIHNLGERIKELRVLHGTALILQKEHKTISEISQEIVSILPAAWQYPEITVIRIRYNDMEFTSLNFSESVWRQRADFTTSDGKSGIIEVFYLKEMPPEVEGPFLAEERSLINTLAEMLKAFYEHRQAVETRRKQQEELQLMLDASPAMIFYKDKENKFIRVNKAHAKATGLPKEKIEGRSCFEIYPQQAEHYWEDDKEVMVSGQPKLNIIETMETKEGIQRWVQTDKIPYRDERGNIIGIIGFALDITERKVGEDKIKKINSIIMSVKAINETLLVTKDEGGLFNEICRLLVKMEFVKAVWIGLTEKGCAEVKPVAQKGFEEGFLTSIKIRLDDSSYKLDPVGMAIKTGESVNIWDIEGSSLPEPWKEEFLERGFVSTIAVPFKHDGYVIGAIGVCADRKYAFGDEEIKYLLEVANDIGVGVKSIRLEKQLTQSLERLRKTFNGTIEAITLMGELRDPYTSGHEKRVAQLACAIAKEIGITEDWIEGIRISAYLHDIGKIIVPAEILSKPMQLSEHEYGIVKTHVRAGYDILKRLDFPFPVAQVILHHHEMLNGSGYPSGLKGEEIIPEARILAVADVVEAMTNHRPYRPALGIDKALEEITRNKGVLYDTKVVDACVNLFTEKGFQFEG